jgi:hypothetical protein
MRIVATHLSLRPSIAVACAVLLLAFARPGMAAGAPASPNPAIDMTGFLDVALAAAEHRATRRVSEDDFIRMSRQPGTVILDARSESLFRMLHVRGALNLSFPDIATDSLARLLPDRNVRILIYCNNNFYGADYAFPLKLPMASLNLSTYVALYTYGYRNVYELEPLLNVRATRVPLEGSAVRDGVVAGGRRVSTGPGGTNRAIMGGWPLPDPWFQSMASPPIQ